MARKDTLGKYRTKRDFSKTAEPGGVLAKKAGNSYLIQKHEASHLHYDFRLELDGVLKSWAVPKGPSLDPHDKRLAMEVEDHPVAYGSFEGIIPKGEYGGGTVMLWDQGTWEPVGNAREGLKKGKLVFRLHGKRLQGEWTLVRFHGHEKSRNQWFLIKHRDELVVEGDNGKYLQENATSVVSERTMEEITEDTGNVWHSKKTKETKAPSKTATTKKKAAQKKVTKLPAFIKPQLATLSEHMPVGEEWLHEIKFDGYRMGSYVENSTVRMISRNDKDWTDAFRPMADFVAMLPVENAIMDGEVVAIDADKKSNFSDLKNALTNGDYSKMQYYVFDLLYLNGEDLRTLPLTQRKDRLEKLLKTLPAKARGRVLYSEHFKSEDNGFFQNACSMHLEGVVSKRGDGPYLSGRGSSWLKTKCIKREEFVIGGYTLPANGSKGVGALLLGYYDEGNLEYAGRVGTGWDAALSLTLRKALDALAQEQCPYVSVTVEGRRKAKWVKPKLVCEIEFSEWTPDGHLRHSSFQGLREDKDAKEVKRDFAVPAAKAEKQAEKEVKKTTPKNKAVERATQDKTKAVVGGIAISHPGRVIYPDVGLTKLQLAEYYDAVAAHVMPHIKDRPLSMLRCPEGAGETCFYQRHIGMGNTPNLHEIAIKIKGESRKYLMIKDEKGLLSLIQWGVIELHPWQCTAESLDKPDRIIFDLDPDPSVSWQSLCEGAEEIKTRMAELGLETFLKTTGGKGLHVVVPFAPVYHFETIKSFAKAVAQSMEHDSPKRYISTMSKTARKGKIFVDYLRNEATSTAVSAFSARARDGATVSMPLFWKELTQDLKPQQFTIETVPALLGKRKRDPWEDFFTVKQKLSAKFLKALNIEPV